MKTLLIDNYDSFTFNVKQFVENCFSIPVAIFRNDDPRLLKIDVNDYFILVLSPGPKEPKDSGHCFHLVRKFFSLNKPILGICLGMQILNEFFGGKTKKSYFPQHGFNSLIQYQEEYQEDKIYAKMPNPFEATRYNSLCCDVRSPELMVNSFLVDCKKSISGAMLEPMSIKHKKKKIVAFQYHPESFLSFKTKKNRNQFISNLRNFFK